MLGPISAWTGAFARTLSDTTIDRTQENDGPPTWKLILATICLIWCITVALVCAVGYIQIQRHYLSIPRDAASTSLPHRDIPHITILRPVKGLEPSLYECLAATFRQTYPRDKLTIYFCISTRDDPAFPVLGKLLADFPEFDAKILIEEDDAHLQAYDSTMGPNPKVRNMSRGYREAKGELIWIIDCNVWIASGVAGRMVDTLCGFTHNGVPGKKYKFVHQLPLVVDTAGKMSREEVEARGLLNGHHDGDGDIYVSSTNSSTFDINRNRPSTRLGTISRIGGGRLEELFMSSSHAKFYTAINTVLIAPCIVGKSNMFRRAHLDHVTSQEDPSRPSGIDFFSENICEDHLIGDLLWRKPVLEEQYEKWGKHCMVFGDFVIQPMAGMSVKEYIARRVRWLRVRKFTVTMATLVEPGTESFLCSIYGAFAVTTLPWFHRRLGIPPSWTAFAVFWFFSVALWAFIDWTLYRKLHSGASIAVDGYTPAFARPPGSSSRRPFREWFLAWLGREALAFPVWFWAVFGGVTVQWRGKRFWVGMDMKVHEIAGQGGYSHAGDLATPRPSSRGRRSSVSAASSLSSSSSTSAPYDGRSKSRRD
ncbi:glycosyltransferase family 21 protein [Xylona heveae TC161]|uniref:Ceramide glucosyltransferase n=1 Tax=Xylona heveae (strain CBS 132557 / TC161) TaxID=1328760 RepID=A0A165AFB6_XYLHT|nr:glycosyltransferase family 21 protein [Xylona heveae TC161]KZF20383.1 glycosyltransferase family 21 protein [Xylona heveae TC161]